MALITKNNYIIRWKAAVILLSNYTQRKGYIRIISANSLGFQFKYLIIGNGGAQVGNTNDLIMTGQICMRFV